MISTIAIVGAGKLGVALAKATLEAGLDVNVAATNQATTALILSVMAPGARATTVAEVAEDADLVVLALPLHRLADLSPDAFAGRVVVDAINYWQPVDGPVTRFGVEAAETSRLVQSHFRGALVVKGLNQLGYHDVEDLRRPEGDPGRVGVALAGDDPAALDLVSDLVNRLGFDPVRVGGLVQGSRIGPGGPAFGVAMTAADLSRALGLG